MPQTITIERIGEGQLPGRKDNMECGFKWYFKSDTFGEELTLDPNIEIAKIEFSAPIGITPEDEIPSEFTIEIQGSCNQCGYCCGLRKNKAEEGACVHIITSGQNKGKCAIYETREDICQDSNCKDYEATHIDCIEAPNQPLRKFNSGCGFSFIIITPNLPITGEEIIYFELANFQGHATEGALIRQ